MEKYVAYVGSYTRGESKGIYIFDVDVKNAVLKERGFFEIDNPSFLAISQDGRYLYSDCDEGVAAFRILEDGGLELINKHSIQGLRPCYLRTDKENRFLVSAGYYDGKLTVSRLEEDGSVGDVTDEIFMKSMQTVISNRNNRCHVNCATFTPDEKYLMAVDLGMDQIKVYDFDHSTGKLRLHDIIRCELDSGPRHIVFSNDKKYFYMTHENANMVSEYSYDSAGPKFRKLSEHSTVSAKFNGENCAVTLKITNDDKYLFVTNSGDNSVAIFKIDDDKNLEQMCVLPVSGVYPRDLYIFPDKQHFVSVNQDSDCLTTFGVNYDKGYIYMSGRPIHVPMPTCIAVKKLG